MTPQRPNVVYIHSHDTGRYVQPYGAPVAMPNYQRIADEGVLFRQAFCAGPTCSPSRAALLTGQWAHFSGMLGLAHRGFRLNDERRHLAHTLKSAGYDTALAGIQHVAAGPDGPARLGYDAVLGKPSVAAAVAAEYIAGRRDTGGRPFFLDVGSFETHRARGIWHHDDGPKGDPRHVRPPAPLPDTPETRQDMADFYESARTLDRKVGVVLGALDAAGIAEDTLVICTTDHGIAFPRMKCSLTDHGIGVLLMLRWPRRLAGGRGSDALVSHVDVFPTLCDLLGIEEPTWLQGRSLAPVLDGAANEVRDELFAEVTYHAAYEPQRAVRTRRWKYIRRWDDRGHPILPNCDDSVSKEVLLAHGWRDRAPAREQLYDLVFDPNEACDLAADPAHAEPLKEMRARLDAWMRETDDPLLAGGHVPPPPGAQVNDPEGLSPQEPTTVC